MQSLVIYSAIIDDAGSAENAMQVLREVTPLSVWQISAGGIAALASLMLPLVHSFLRLYA